MGFKRRFRSREKTTRGSKLVVNCLFVKVFNIYIHILYILSKMRIDCFFFFFLDYGKVSFMIASFTFSLSRTKGSFGSVTFVSRNFKNGAILACRGVIDKSKIASQRS